MIHCLKKADFLLFLFFLAAAALTAALPGVSTSPSGGKAYETGATRDFGSDTASDSRQKVRIMYAGEFIGLYPLDKDQDVEILRKGHRNLVSIHDSTVRMEESDCKNQICVNTGAISRTGELIVCLPNQVIVEIVSSAEGGEDHEEIDAVVK